MPHLHNSQTDLPDVTWIKSRRSGKLGNCVELAGGPGSSVAVRNSRFPEGPALLFAPDEMSAFLADIKAGGFDDLLPAEHR